MNHEEIEEWLKTRPDCVQCLAAEFPPNTVFDLPDGSHLFLIGWTESDSLIVSAIDPSEDYDRSIREKEYIHADCVREARHE